jgi:hypothetical protein
MQMIQTRSVSRCLDNDNTHLLTPICCQRISGLAIKNLFSQIPFAGLDAGAGCFEVDEIIRMIKQNESEIRFGSTTELMSASNTS